jgi:tRNA pseudouridine38-40 synthase
MEQRAGTVRRIALVLQYDGTAFNGWQLQNGGRTVQGELERAIKVHTGEAPRVTASGRTDTGVHALYQVVHFDISGGISLERMAIGLNGIMNRDLAVRNVYEVSSDFHARFSTREREYLYVIYNHPQRSPFMRYRSMWVNFPLDEKYLEQTLRLIEGTHDFASFCKKKSRLENTVREIYHTSARRLDDHINITIRGNAFLHNMIRIIIGTSVSMYREGRDPSYIRDVLEMKDRDCSGVTAPPYGLYLNMVKYDPDLSAYEKAFPEFPASTE